MAEGGTQEAQIESSEDEERELENLESDVTEMATKIAECRDTLPNQLTSTLASLLTAQRPVLSSSFDFGSDPGPSGHSASGDTSRHAELGASSVQAEEEKEYAEKIQLLKQKLSNNASAMPNVLKRMEDCISRIDKLDSYNGDIHPAFKRKRSR
ncbi:hypothetical protein DCAR_0207822 [Daucus carota subsp. sativus]|uniref:Uncharacterized protein n=1 Tax=Daucus carota subsp. sativus TaxID=79200 RepID=A0A161XGJ1_DAUCS|nr:PREDICTED: uncharacterized protein LOC108209833 [Daucus carota subsp. sativus]WOG88587.1 hypothetical protein DCAR_0207822 [Daucus carota subsp. sativus]